MRGPGQPGARDCICHSFPDSCCFNTIAVQTYRLPPTSLSASQMMVINAKNKSVVVFKAEWAAAGNTDDNSGAELKRPTKYEANTYSAPAQDG